MFFYKQILSQVCIRGKGMQSVAKLIADAVSQNSFCAVLNCNLSISIFFFSASPKIFMLHIFGLVGFL